MKVGPIAKLIAPVAIISSFAAAGAAFALGERSASHQSCAFVGYRY